MSKVIVTKSKITDIADKIRTKKGITNDLTLTEMNNELDPLVEPVGSVDITENGTYNVSGKARANVNVPTPQPTYWDGTYEESDE